MVMDRNFSGFFQTNYGIKLEDETSRFYIDPEAISGLTVDDTYLDRNFVENDSKSECPPNFLDPNLMNNDRFGECFVGENQITKNFSSLSLPSCPYPNSISGPRFSEEKPQLSYVPESDTRLNVVTPTIEGDGHEDYDFSDVVLKYIGQMLMEEDMEEKACMFQESAALQAAERSLYEVIGEKYPPSPEHSKSQGLEYFDRTRDFADTNNVDYDLCPNWDFDPVKRRVPENVSFRTNSQSSHSSSSSSGTINDGYIDSPVSTLRIHDMFNTTESVIQFKRGIEEANKFLPNGNGSVIDLRYSGLGKRQIGKKNLHHEEDGDSIEGMRSHKQSAMSSESSVIKSEMFDTVLLCSGGKNESALRKSWQIVSSKNSSGDEQSRGSNGKKSRGKKQGGKLEVVDLRTLLTLCAQSVAADDRRTAEEFLRQIRQHSSQTGDGMQRIAHYFADGLEARMAGSGTQIYKALINMPTSAADVLKAYQLYLAACPFRKISNFFSNKTIMNLARDAKTVHIIDFGILYGFQWPCFIQRLSSRPGGPPRLRITGIDLPQPGFRPAERVEETGRRLANYAERFGVPFEFNAIAQKWETVKIEDLKIERGEILAVNCLYRFRNLLDETVVVNSPRDNVLKLIHKLNPDVLIMGIVNGAYNAPFFITRFREALFHFSSLFDMLEANIPREIHERMLLEKTIFGYEAMNVIACEAAERIERPETYKQWQVRNMRAGFRQLPLNEEIMRMSRDRVRAYHKDFIIDQDGQWLLQGWKGRIIYALSTWKAAA